MITNIGITYPQTVSATNPEYLKIISRVLVYKMIGIEPECLDNLKSLLLNSLSSVSVKDRYEITQFLLDHAEAFNSIKFTNTEINELEKIHTNIYHKFYEFPSLTFLAVNKVISSNQRFFLSSDWDKITLKAQLDGIGESVPRLRENKQKIFSMFYSKEEQQMNATQDSPSSVRDFSMVI